MAEAVSEPDYLQYDGRICADEGTKEGFVRLKIKIPKLKVKSAAVCDRLLNRHRHPKGKNAKIEVPTFNARSFELNVRGDKDGEMKGAQYCLKIHQLPFAIEANDCYIKAEEGWIYMFLKKSDVGESWETYIRNGTLETASHNE